jgi:lipopolysaccharide export LptBFGC system permease protein LptF
MEVSDLVNFFLSELFKMIILVFGILTGFWIINNAVGGGD